MGNALQGMPVNMAAIPCHFMRLQQQYCKVPPMMHLAPCLQGIMQWSVDITCNDRPPHQQGYGDLTTTWPVLHLSRHVQHGADGCFPHLVLYDVCCACMQAHRRHMQQLPCQVVAPVPHEAAATAVAAAGVDLRRSSPFIAFAQVAAAEVRSAFPFNHWCVLYSHDLSALMCAPHQRYCQHCWLCYWHLLYFSAVWQSYRCVGCGSGCTWRTTADFLPPLIGGKPHVGVPFYVCCTARSESPSTHSSAAGASRCRLAPQHPWRPGSNRRGNWRGHELHQRDC